MNTQTQRQQTDAPVIHPATRLGRVHYTAADLERQIAFYRDILGFKVHWRERDEAGLGAGGEDLLRLTERADARRVRGATGLYHTAFLLPTRWDLAHLLRRIAETRSPIQGMTNHGTHYAIYLPDAEDNGIELAWDFPKEQWPRSFQEMMRRHRGLAPEEVFRALEDNPAPWEGLSPAAKVGHVHLHVAELEPTYHFYHEIMGFDLPFEPMDTAIFFSAGGYHHHIGTNVWQGIGAPPPPENAIGLRYFSVIVPDAAELDRLVERIRQAGFAAQQTPDGWLARDPSQNGVLLRAE